MTLAYIDIRVVFDTDGTIKQVDELQRVSLETFGMQADCRGKTLEPDEYFTRSDEPEPAWMICDKGPGHPRIMVLQGTHSEDTPEDQ